jgi:acyl carrier protein
MDTLRRLQQMLANTLRIDAAQVRPDDALKELFEWYGGGSLDLAEFTLAVEGEFESLELSDDEAAQWGEMSSTMTLRQLADFIDRNGRPPASA